MNLKDKEANLIFSIMKDLSNDFNHFEIRQRVGQSLLELLNADHFASYVWDENTSKFVSGVKINMTDRNIASYNDYYQFKDPITPRLQRRKKATPVSEVMPHNNLIKTEFYNDFLKQDGLCYGINFFAYDRGSNIGDIRIWRGNKKEEFSQKDVQIIDAIGPSFVNALIRASEYDNECLTLRFTAIGDKFNLTPREREIADLLVIGASDEEIFSKLIISKSTLRSHIAAIFKKTGLCRRTQLAQFLADNSGVTSEIRTESVN